MKLFLWFVICIVSLYCFAYPRALVRRLRVPKYLDGLCSWGSWIIKLHPFYDPDQLDRYYTLRGNGGEWLPIALHLDMVYNTDRAFNSM